MTTLSAPSYQKAVPAHVWFDIRRDGTSVQVTDDRGEIYAPKA